MPLVCSFAKETCVALRTFEQVHTRGGRPRRGDRFVSCLCEERPDGVVLRGRAAPEHGGGRHLCRKRHDGVLPSGGSLLHAHEAVFVYCDCVDVCERPVFLHATYECVKAVLGRFPVCEHIVPDTEALTVRGPLRAVCGGYTNCFVYAVAPARCREGDGLGSWVVHGRHRCRDCLRGDLWERTEIVRGPRPCGVNAAHLRTPFANGFHTARGFGVRDGPSRKQGLHRDYEPVSRFALQTDGQVVLRDLCKVRGSHRVRDLYGRVHDGLACRCLEFAKGSHGVCERREDPCDYEGDLFVWGGSHFLTGYIHARKYLKLWS